MNNATRSRHNLGWLWYLLGLSAITAAIVSTTIVYVFSQKLTLAKVEAAHAQWREQGTPNYEMKYTVDHNGTTDVTYYVKVRDGKIIEATKDNERLSDPADGTLTMDQLFDQIESWMREDAEPGKPRTFASATFSKTDGRVTHFYRQILSTGEKIEYEVELGHTTAEGEPIKRLEKGKEKP